MEEVVHVYQRKSKFLSVSLQLDLMELFYSLARHLRIAWHLSAWTEEFKKKTRKISHNCQWEQI